MKIIQSHPTFYVELSPEEIFLCPKHGVGSSYPVWLGKNRSVMRTVIRRFEKDPPKSFLDCLDIIAHYELNGVSSRKKALPELFTKTEKSLDNERVFW